MFDQSQSTRNASSEQPDFLSQQIAPIDILQIEAEARRLRAEFLSAGAARLAGWLRARLAPNPGRRGLI
jgi:hypothetical protein